MNDNMNDSMKDKMNDNMSDDMNDLFVLCDFRKLCLVEK